jgi:hypothetical protein
LKRQLVKGEITHFASSEEEKPLLFADSTREMGAGAV